jgi:hypothetical protein
VAGRRIVHLVNRVAYFSDDFQRFMRTPDAEQLPSVASRMELLTDPAVKGVAVVTAEEDVTIHLRETATHSLGERLDLFAREYTGWRAARISSLEARVPGVDAVASIDFQRNATARARTWEREI